METTTIITISEVAQILRVSQWTVRRLMREEKLPFVQFKKWSNIFFNRELVLRWWNEHQQPKPAVARAREIKALRRRKA
jgi:excisionase family DNA binding protein